MKQRRSWSIEIESKRETWPKNLFLMIYLKLDTQNQNAFILLESALTRAREHQQFRSANAIFNASSYPDDRMAHRSFRRMSLLLPLASPLAADAFSYLPDFSLICGSLRCSCRDSGRQSCV